MTKGEEEAMSTNVTLAEARARLEELVGSLAPGEEIVLTDGKRPVAKIVHVPRRERKLGMMGGTSFYMAPDFDAPLEDFKEYM